MTYDQLKCEKCKRKFKNTKGFAIKSLTSGKDKHVFCSWKCLANFFYDIFRKYKIKEEY
jgi:hypothetical protein